MNGDHVAMYMNDLEQVTDFFLRYLDGKAGEACFILFSCFFR